MTKSNYATDTNVALLMIGIADDISTNLATYVLNATDVWVDSIIGTAVSKTATPAKVMQAAEYYAGALTLRILYDVSQSDSPQVADYEKKARDLLNAYEAETVDEFSDAHPYSSSLTPTQVYTKRNLRTMQDDDESEYDNVEEDEWNSER